MRGAMRSPAARTLAVCLCVAFASGCTTVHDSGELKAIFDKGVAAYDAGRYAEAFQLFQSIDDEDVAAMRNEGLMLRKGLGTAKDPAAAEAMLGHAAELGLPTAQYRLGVFYEEGTLVEKNLDFARTLYTDAAARGVPEAKARLAKLPAPETKPPGP